MHRRLRGIASIATAFVIIGGIPQANADLIKLNNGGEIRGKIARKLRAKNSAEVAIETLGGALVVVARKQVRFVTRRPLTVEVYETRAKSTPSTLDAQWELAEWCRKNRLKSQRKVHLRIILELDPDHKKAHYGLGHSRYHGEWKSRDEVMLSRGYVKHKGRYVTPQELELIEKTQVQRDAERKWYQKVRLWHGWLTEKHSGQRQAARRKAGLAELQKLTSPDAVAALTHFFQDDENNQVRALYVQILAQVPGARPVQPLVQQSLQDSNYEIRYQALNAISSEQYGTATPYFVRELKHKNNAIVRRAAMALGRVGDEGVFPNLVDALVTTHKYRVRVPDNKGLSFGTNGSFGNTRQVPPSVELMIRSGQFPFGVIVNNPQPNRLRSTKVVHVKYDHQNAEVLSALKKLTGESFGFDKRTWRLWWLAQKHGTGKTKLLP